MRNVLCAICVPVAVKREQTYIKDTLSDGVLCGMGASAICSALQDGCMRCCVGWVQCSAGWVHALLCGMGAVLCGMGACVAVWDGCSVLRDGCMRCCAGWVQCSAGWVHACVAVRDGYIECGQRLSVARVKRDITQHVCTLFGYQPFLCILCIILCISVFSREKIRKDLRKY